jgi:hypothetical protein
MDANNPPDAAVVDNDQQSVTPDVPVTPDTPTPPPVDVPATPPDTPTPDASVTPDVPATPDATMMSTEFSPGTCGELPRHQWRFQGTSGAGDTIGCRMQGDGTALLDFPDNIAARLGDTSAICTREQTCHVPMPTVTNHWVCNGWNTPMTSFTCSRMGERLIIEATP